MTDLVSDFELAYQARIVGAIPAGIQPVMFRPADDNRMNPDCTYVHIQPQSRPDWYGAFCRSRLRSGIEVLKGTPDATTLCVVARGTAYCARTDLYGVYDLIPLEPVEHVIEMLEGSAIVVLSRTHVGAWRGAKRFIMSPRVSYDGIRNVHTNGRILTGEGWFAPREEWIAFSFDAQNGECNSGLVLGE